MAIAATIELTARELAFLDSQAEQVVRPIAWLEATGKPLDWRLDGEALATEQRRYGERIREAIERQAQELRENIKNSSKFRLALEITPDFDLQVTPSSVLEIVFQTYRPRDLGIIDYHGPNREYVRETLGGVNLDLESLMDQRRQQSLYNIQNKYKNIKNELAASYVREMIAAKAGSRTTSDLNETLTELFETFFPLKSYGGPRPTQSGTVEFPVVVDEGGEHDVDELSDGEKEILYGYLRLRNSALRDSVVLLDEPELHLNPRLLQGLPDFYHRHVGQAFGNQMWLVTHSDALLRQSVERPGFSVFHMRLAATLSEGENQVTPVTGETEMDRAVIDLVGDLAAFNPDGRIVILEGGGDTEFDRQLIERLFPDFSERVNLVLGGSKRRVADLYEILDRASESAGLKYRFSAIVDRDLEYLTSTSRLSEIYSWDRYHIENYLLDPEAIVSALLSINPQSRLTSPDEVTGALRKCAVSLIESLVIERLTHVVNSELVGTINVGADPKGADGARALRNSIEGSRDRFDRAAQQFLNSSRIDDLASQERAQLENAIESGTWDVEFPGRRILRRFTGDHVAGISGEAFANLVLDHMVRLGREPEGMKRILDQVLDTEA